MTGPERFITEPARQTLITDSCDVLVAGGGIAGIAAAAAAARCGAKVILAEREYGLGGMATLGLITIYLPLCDGEGNQLVYGLGEELLLLSIEHGAEANYPRAWLDGGTVEERRKYRYITQYNPHLFALRAEKFLLGLGVRILYGSVACAVEVRDGLITHVIVENKSGRGAIAAGAVVDATGDADICALAGAKTALYKPGNALASWYYYHAGGQVSLKMFGLADLAPKRDADIAAAPEQGGGGKTVYSAKIDDSVDKTARFSGVDGGELSAAVIKVRQIMYEDILKAKKADETLVPVTTASVPLVRMSRRIVGAADADVADDHKYIADSIGMTGDWRKRGPAFEIPYRALWGREIKNLITAGRDISATDEMWDVTRVIPPCAVTGEAAGTAAAMTRDFAALDVYDLQAKLRANGVKLHFND